MNHPAPAVPQTVSRVDFHRGNTLWKLANTYSSLPLTIIEGVQNAIDGAAQHILVGIDYKSRRVAIADDGQGVNKWTFERALTSVGQTIKRSDQLGRFGLGLISPLNKCTSFTFMSAPLPDRRSMKWTFNAKAIKESHTEIAIPCESIRELPKLPAPFRYYATGDFNVAWRTLVTMNGVTQDKVISTIDLDELEGDMLTKLGVRMREKSVQVRVILVDSSNRIQQRDICASDYAGEKLPVVTYDDDPDAGSVEISLYRAQKLAGKRQGVVTVAEMHNPAAISIHQLARQARSSKMKDTVESAIAALSSGYFEGTIKCAAITLHPERTKFENDDALIALFIALALWYNDHGEKLFEKEHEDSQERRYQELGLKSQEKLRSILSRPEYGRLLASLHSSVNFGRLGNGHSTPAKGRPNGFEEVRSIRVGQGGAGTPRTSAKPTPPRSSSQPGKDRPGDTPFGATGPMGRPRRLVKGDSQGLWYEYSVLVGSSHLWEFDFELGILTFNIRHPLWVNLDETKGKHLARNAKWIMHLQEWITLQVLHLLVQCPEPDLFEDRRAFIDDQAKLYVEMFIVASR